MLITGSSADGSDAIESTGVYVSSYGTLWSSKPITREQKAFELCHQHCDRYRKTFYQLYLQIKSGEKTNLRKWVRNWMVNYIEEFDVEQEVDKSYPLVNLEEVL